METTVKKMYAPDELVCAVAIHPGEMLRDELQARGISQRKFAGIIGMPYTAFNEIINGKRSITTDTALKIEAATGISATMWLGLQADIICIRLGVIVNFLTFWRIYVKLLQFFER